LPPVVAGHRWPSSSNALSNKRPRFNPPYIPALKDRGFTARLVRLAVRFVGSGRCFCAEIPIRTSSGTAAIHSTTIPCSICAFNCTWGLALAPDKSPLTIINSISYGYVCYWLTSCNLPIACAG
jgi:hypothetical protein